MKQLRWIASMMLAGWYLSSCLCLNVPPNYGKTQFIIGATKKDLKENKPVTSPLRKPRTIPLTQLTQKNTSHVFFSPDDDVIGLLIDLINHEQQSIKMAVYMITQKAVAQALIGAQNRGVLVEIITDNFCSKSVSGIIPLLKQHHIPLYVYQGCSETTKMSNIMHHKFIIFEKNIQGKTLAWTGSFNVTHSAQRNNQENVVIICDESTIKEFTAHFEVLKQRCRQQSSPTRLVRTSTKQKKRKQVAYAKRSRNKITT